MRPWRKLYSKVLESDQVAALSIEAKWLFVLLIAAQDDTGYYPWTRAKVQRLTPTCPDWSFERVTQLAREIVECGIARWQDEGIVLAKGEHYNGRPREDRQADVYDRNLAVNDIPVPASDSQRKDDDAPRSDQIRSDQIRVEEIRSDQIRGERRNGSVAAATDGRGAEPAPTDDPQIPDKKRKSKAVEAFEEAFGGTE